MEDIFSFVPVSSRQAKESGYRSLIKSISWRVLGTLDTMVISYLVMGHGSELQAATIGLSELFTKVLLYYFHERGWLYLMEKWGWHQTPRVSLLKAITWRIAGSLDTLLLATWVSGDPLIGLKISGTELLTKILLYYLHERAWAKVPIGTVRKWFRKPE